MRQTRQAIVRRYYVELSDSKENDNLRLPSNGYVAKTQNHAAAGCKAPETHLWTETRKQEHLVELARDDGIVRTGKNPIIHGFAFRVDGDFH